MKRMHVMIRLDTEDFLQPASDDAVLQLARIMGSLAVKGIFNITGKKTETLLARGRSDIMRAVSSHDICYHTYSHSIPPSVRDYLKNMEWDEGVNEFIRREARGIEILKRAFGRTPSGYGQPGGTWTPHSYGAMRRLNMPVYVCGVTYPRIDYLPTWYCGILQAVPSPGGDCLDIDELKKAHLAAYDGASPESGALFTFCAHDYNYGANQTWDALNFMNGRNPPEKDWKLPPASSDDQQRERLAVFKDYIRFVKSLDHSQFVTAVELARLYQDKTKEKNFSKDEIAELAQACLDGIDYQKTDGGYVSAAEIFWLSVSSISRTIADGAFPDKCRIKDIVGPSHRVVSDKDLDRINTEVFLKSVLDTHDFINFHGKMPSEIWVGSTILSPADYLATLAYHWPRFAEGDFGGNLHVQKADLLSERYVHEEVAHQAWKWLDTKGSFKGDHLLEIARLQAWTIKPAVLA